MCTLERLGFVTQIHASRICFSLHVPSVAGTISVAYEYVRVSHNKSKYSQIYEAGTGSSPIPSFAHFVKRFVHAIDMNGAAPGIEPGTSRTLSENHATRPSSRLEKHRNSEIYI